MTPPSDIVRAGQDALAGALRGSQEARNRLEELRSHLLAMADDGDAEAQSLLGGIALEYSEDPDAALRFWTLAADQGHPAGRRGLGHLFSAGLGVAQDRARAANLFRLAADGGDVHAKYNLGVLHLRHQDELTERIRPEELDALFRSAAEHGIKEACTELGNLLARLGRDDEALTWYLRAAERGDASAMFTAARWYRDGHGTEPNPVEAVRWFLKMLDVKDGNGVHEAIQLAGSMTDDQIHEVGRLLGDPAAAAALISTVRHR